MLEQIGNLAPEQRVPRMRQISDEASNAGRREEAKFFNELAMASQAQLHAVALIGQKQFDEAIRELDNSDMRLDRLPIDSAWLRNQRAFNYKTYAQAFLAKGESAQAGRYLDRAQNSFEQVKNDPRASPRDRASAIHGIGNVEHLRGNDRAAIALFNEAGRLDPANGFIWYDRFVAYHKLAEQGQVDLAAMRESVAFAKAASFPTQQYIASLEAALRRWEAACAGGARAC
jgi:tetratricopeptide (TPR) repeat protein